MVIFMFRTVLLEHAVKNGLISKYEHRPRSEINAEAR
jgi:hypothetical protein